METEKIYISSDRKYKIIIRIIIVLCLLIYYLVMILLAPAKKYEEIKGIFGFKQDENKPVDERIFTDSTYLSLLKEKSFLQSRVTMAESDSIYLTVNMPDSTVNLEINGVVVHKADIKKMNISRILKAKNDYTILSLLSSPFTISKNIASIEKEPLMIKMAPKDTSEFKPDIIPDTADYEPVNFIMEMDNGTTLYIYQEGKLRPGDGMRLFIFDMRYRLNCAGKALLKIVTFKVPDYQLFIKLRIPRTDAKIIYRALPEQGQVAVYI
jgi:hypothetical protein